jgi:hypothetical protein
MGLDRTTQARGFDEEGGRRFLALLRGEFIGRAIGMIDRRGPDREAQLPQPYYLAQNKGVRDARVFTDQIGQGYAPVGTRPDLCAGSANRA